MRIVNLTGHRLVLGHEDDCVGYESRGRVRIDTKYRTVREVELANENGLLTGVEIPVLELANGDVASLPAAIRGSLYVVSGLVASRVRRRDVVAPVRFARGADGKVEYARALLQYREDG